MIDHSVCTREILCAFEIVKVYADYSEEVCKFCNKRVRYNKVDGVVDNRQYLLDHRRDVLQSTGPDRALWLRIYGTELDKRNANLRKEWAAKADDKEHGMQRAADRAREALKSWRRLEGQGHTQAELARDLQAHPI